MNQLTPKLASILIVPNQGTQSFGSLFEIKSEPDEIFVSAATVNDIETITEITAKEIQASGTIVTSSIAVSTTSGITSIASTSEAVSTATTSGGLDTSSASSSTSSSSTGSSY